MVTTLGCHGDTLSGHCDHCMCHGDTRIENIIEKKIEKG